MDNEDFRPPYEPDDIPEELGGCLSKYCVSPTNGRLEWIQATIKPHHLGTGYDVQEDMKQFLLAGDKNPMDQPALIIHASLGGRGDEVWNVFLEGRSFDRETFDNEVESTIYYALKDQDPNNQSVVTVRFIFKNTVVTRPYKLSYQIELPNGDVIENELVNV